MKLKDLKEVANCKCLNVGVWGSTAPFDDFIALLTIYSTKDGYPKTPYDEIDVVQIYAIEDEIYADCANPNLPRLKPPEGVLNPGNPDQCMCNGKIVNTSGYLIPRHCNSCEYSNKCYPQEDEL